VKPLRICGVIVAGGGGVALVSAITAMDRIGSCGNGYDAPCPPGIANDFYLMGGAVAAIAVGSVMSLGIGLLVAMLTAGGAAVGYALTVPASMRTGEYVTAGVSLGLLALVFAMGLSVLRQSGTRRRAATERTAADERFRQRAVMVAGTVTALRDTGVTVNDNPQAVVVIGYTRPDGTPGQAETVQVLPRLEIPRSGDPATVWYDPATGEARAALGSPGPWATPA
jgi:hypothetical protein